MCGRLRHASALRQQGDAERGAFDIHTHRRLRRASAARHGHGDIARGSLATPRAPDRLMGIRDIRQAERRRTRPTRHPRTSQDQTGIRGAPPAWQHRMRLARHLHASQDSTGVRGAATSHATHSSLRTHRNRRRAPETSRRPSDAARNPFDLRTRRRLRPASAPPRHLPHLVCSPQRAGPHQRSNTDSRQAHRPRRITPPRAAHAGTAPSPGAWPPAKRGRGGPAAR